MSKQSKSTRPRDARWWAIRGGIALLLAYALYLLAGNLFVNAQWARSLVNAKPGKFQMAWVGGHTLWPGYVTLREVSMQGHVRRTSWSVNADRASGRIALWPLLRKQIRVPWVEAEAVTGSVARSDTEIPRPEHRPGGWTLRMDRIASDSIQGGDVFGWAIAGKGEAEVGFSKQFRGGPAELLPSSATFTQLTASHDGEQWLRDARVASTFSLASHLSSEYPGIEKLALFAATLELEGKAPALRSAFDEDGRYRFDTVQGEGSVEAKLTLARGSLVRGDRLLLQVPMQVVDPGGDTHANVLDLALSVEDDLHLRAHLPEREGARLSLDADLRMPGTTLPVQDWRARLAHSTGSLRGRWHVPSIGALVGLFAQADWLSLEGSGTVEGDLRLADGGLVEGSRLRAEDVDATARVLGNRFHGKAKADAVVEATAEGGLRSRVDIAMRRFDASPAGTPSRKYVTGDDLRVNLVSDAQLERVRETLQARVRFDRARIPDLAVFNPYLPNDRLRFGGGSGVLTGDLQVDGDGDVGTGHLRVDGRRARLSVAGIDLQGDVVIDARLQRGNLQRGNFQLGGSRVEVRNVAFVEPGGTSHAGWWAVVELDGGRVAWQQPPSAGGRIRARMKDVGFLLALFANRADYPAWIGRIVDDGEARLQGHWAWRGDELLLDRVHASNDRFKVDARMKLQGSDRRGDLHVGWGRLGVGVELQGTQRKFHVRNARDWYDGRPNLLP
ncbi:MAG: hypothetical protein NVV60_11135 [Luteimonas sp.]|nr:hypothetical protein [Luteimonas sp.]